MKKIFTIILIGFIGLSFPACVFAANEIPQLANRLNYLLPPFAKCRTWKNDYDTMDCRKETRPIPTAGQLWSIPEAELDAVKEDAEAEAQVNRKEIKALIEWIGSKHGLTPQQAKQEFKNIIKNQ
jgi:hypothetical protein